MKNKELAAAFEKARIEGFNVGYQEGLSEARVIEQNADKSIQIIKIALLEAIADLQLAEEVKNSRKGGIN